MHVCVIGLRGVPNVIGGIEAQCERLYPAIVANDADVRVTLLIRRGYGPEDRFDFRGTQVLSLWSPFIWGVDTVVHTAWAILYAWLRLKPDIIHIHGIGPAFFTPLAWLLRVRTVVTHHAPDYQRPKWGHLGRLFLMTGERLAGRFANRVVCVSDWLRDDFLQRVPAARRRTVAIRHAGSLDDIATGGSSTVLDDLDLEAGRYLLAVGRLEATKGFHELVAAFAGAGLDGYKLAIVGSAAGNTAYAEALQEQAPANVVFAGYRSGADLRQLYEGAALFVHPSHMEGFGLVVAEALSAGIPILLSDIPPHREFGLEPQCYLPVGDVDALTAALTVQDYSAYLSREAIAHHRTDWSIAARDHIALYTAIMAD
ncbi:glycosyltransferase family 4 protein [Croceibacterium sp. TMG7-5b_MA50]|uniref:glycosyltransferase family 4 protein n=1 Tax=Croceibacterium sp. TMG7-5b_MA50 TaxID=3121290 RepID=UPI0032217F69